MALIVRPINKQCRIYVHRRDPMVNLNYAVFLYNLGDRKAAVKQFSAFEQKFQALKSSNPSEIDQEVNGAYVYRLRR